MMIEDFKFIEPRRDDKSRRGEMSFKLIEPGEVRVRIAPSPTGRLHLGLARTALFNYLFVKERQGSFILRIEDTDIKRSKPEYEEDILESLKWLGINWDEGPIASAQNQKYIGDYGPYRQSERLNIYAKYIEKLLAEDKAYYCFCSGEELEAQRQYQLSIGEAPRYSGKCANLSKEERGKRMAEGKPSIIRFRAPAKKVEFDDLIRGRLEFDAGLLGDIAIAKDLATRGPNESLGRHPPNHPPKGPLGRWEGWSPLYNLAVVIDDFEMKISHIIRGEEHISNAPKQILLQEALGFPRPIYSHLPLILAPDRTKLSKRHGAVAISAYRKQGYLPESLINFMAFLGWNPGTEREIYSTPSLIKEFSLERVQKGGAVFNIKRLDFLNGFYIRQRSVEKLTELCLPYLIEEGLITPVFKTEQYPPAYGLQPPHRPPERHLGIEIKQNYQISETGEKISLDFIKKIVSIYQERLKKLSEISELTGFFFKDKLEYDKNLLKWVEMSDRDIAHSLDRLEKVLSKIKAENWTKENLENQIMPEAEKFAKEIKKPAGDRGYLLWPFRVALTGKEASAGPFEIAEILGKEKTLKRIKEARGLLR